LQDSPTFTQNRNFWFEKYTIWQPCRREEEEKMLVAILDEKKCARRGHQSVKMREEESKP
jgi:hypothetical protein